MVPGLRQEGLFVGLSVPSILSFGSLLFAEGLIVTAAALAGAFVIGLTEAADSDHARPSDLTNLERKVVIRNDEKT